jgi:glycosyltransferase involved in cell wall biosynthesis
MALGDAARQKVVERFSIARMIADYARLYAAYGQPR